MMPNAAPRSAASRRAAPRSPLAELPPDARIGVFRALQLGDMLCAVPALRALRAACPRAQITLVGLPWARWFAERFTAYVDAFVEFPGMPGLPELTADVARVPGFLAGMQLRALDLAVQLHGSGLLTNPLVALFGARTMAGFHEPGAWCPDARRCLPWPDEGSEVERLLALPRHLGAPDAGTALELPIRDADRAELADTPEVAELTPGSYLCIHAGARHAHKRWAPERFAAIGDAASALGLQVVLTGTTAERPLAEAVRGAMRAPAIDAAGPMSLGAMAALIGGARLMVCNDTGVSHIAAALGVPSVVVFLAADPERWAPLDRARHRVVYDPASCAGRRPAAGDGVGRPSGGRVAVAAVLEEMRALLDAPAPLTTAASA